MPPPTNATTSSSTSSPSLAGAASSGYSVAVNTAMLVVTSFTTAYFAMLLVLEVSAFAERALGGSAPPAPPDLAGRLAGGTANRSVQGPVPSEKGGGAAPPQAMMDAPPLPPSVSRRVRRSTDGLAGTLLFNTVMSLAVTASLASAAALVPFPSEAACKGLMASVAAFYVMANLAIILFLVSKAQLARAAVDTRFRRWHAVACRVMRWASILGFCGAVLPLIGLYLNGFVSQDGVCIMFEDPPIPSFLFIAADFVITVVLLLLFVMPILHSAHLVAESNLTSSKQLRRLAHRNALLAVACILSTVVSLILFSVSMIIAAHDRAGYGFLAQVGTLVASFDLFVNSVLIRLMTSVWMPSWLKKSARLSKFWGFTGSSSKPEQQNSREGSRGNAPRAETADGMHGSKGEGSFASTTTVAVAAVATRKPSASASASARSSFKSPV